MLATTSTFTTEAERAVSMTAWAFCALPPSTDNFVFINQPTENESNFIKEKPPAVAAARDGHSFGMGARPAS